MAGRVGKGTKGEQVAFNPRLLLRLKCNIRTVGKTSVGTCEIHITNIEFDSKCLCLYHMQYMHRKEHTVPKAYKLYITVVC